MSLGALDNFQETPAPVPPSAADLLVGNTLFVSTQGLGGLYEDLTYHYSDPDLAIAAISTNADTVIFYPGSYTITVNPTVSRLHLFLHTGASVNIDTNFSGVGSIDIGGDGIVVFNQEPADASILNFVGNQFSIETTIATVNECTYCLQATTTISIQAISQNANLAIHAKALQNIVLGDILVNSGFSFILSITCDQITCTTLLFNFDINFEQEIIFNGKSTWTPSTPGIEPIALIGTGSDNLSDVIRFNGDVTTVSDSISLSCGGAIFNFSNYNWISIIITNDVTTQNIPVFLVVAGGIILKNCNIKSSNAQRLFGFVRTDIAGTYIQIDSATFSDLDGTIVGAPDVITTAVAPTTFIGLRAAYTNACARFFDPVNFTNNFPAGTAQLARLAGFQA